MLSLVGLVGFAALTRTLQRSWFGSGTAISFPPGLGGPVMSESDSRYCAAARCGSLRSPAAYVVEEGGNVKRKSRGSGGGGLGPNTSP